MKCSFLRRVALCASLGLLAMFPCAALGDSEPVRVEGPGIAPQIEFACCDHGIESMQGLFAHPRVMDDLKALHASVAVAITDFSPERARAVQSLHQAGIPAIAWIMLPPEQGFYLNADNAPAASGRVAAFEKWTRDNNLQWAGVGLDIEPNFLEFTALRNHRWHLAATLLRWALDRNRMIRARLAYSALIRAIQSTGYPVQTYQMPYVVAERSTGSTLLDRMLGTVDVSGNQEYLMLYTSFARPVGAGMIWSLGRGAQGIGVGSTDGDTPPGSGAGPLDWDEFSRDLLVAGHASKTIGVYDLEGCVRQGFLPRLMTMDWSQSVVIPAASVARARRLGLFLRTVLWIASHLLLLAALSLASFAWLAWRWRLRKAAKQLYS